MDKELKKQSGEGQASPVFIPAGHYYTALEVSEMYQLDRRSIIHWLKRGWVKGIKIGMGWLIEADSIEGFTPPKPGPKVKNDTTK